MNETSLENLGFEFDENFYLEKNPYVAGLKISPLTHYLKYGKALGYLPYKKGSTIKKTALRNKQNICIASSGIMGPTGAGGVAKCTVNILNLIEEINISKNYEINITLLYTGHPYYHSKDYSYWKDFFESKYSNCNFEVLVIPETYGTQFMKRSYGILEHLKNHQTKFDRIIFHDFQGIAYFSLLAKKSGIAFSETQLIVNSHGNLRLSNFFGKKSPESHDDLITMFMEGKSIELADYVISPSQFYLNWWGDYTNVNARTSISLNNYTIREVSENIKKNKKNKYHIAFYGRLEILKGLNLFIETIKEVKIKSGENGIYKEFFDNLKISFIGNSVKINGHKSEDYIYDNCKNFIDKIDVFTSFNTAEAFNYMLETEALMVLPTLGETSSCVVSEAIVNDVPFLAADIPAIKELVSVTYHNTHLFECGNKHDLIDKLLNIVKKPTLGSFARPMSETRKDWIDILTGVHCVYENTNNKFSSIHSQPLVSVIVPTYNRYEELDESLTSLNSQNYKNIEIIVVDDNSENQKLVNEICIKNNAKLITSDKKLFKGKACNLGVKNSTGKYILFFDDDDLIEKNAITRYVGVLENYQDIDISSGFCSVFENEKYLKDKNIEEEYISLALGSSISSNLISNYFGKGSFIIRRLSFNSVGGYDEDNTNTHMVDYRFYTKASMKGLSIHIIPTAQYYYRKNSKGSLYYENSNDFIKLFNAKRNIFEHIKEKCPHELHDLLKYTIFNHTYPKIAKPVINKEILAWLSNSKLEINVAFNHEVNDSKYFNIFSSDGGLILNINFRFKEKSLILNHKIDDVYQKEIKIELNFSSKLKKNSTTFKLQIIDNKILLTVCESNASHNYEISHVKHKNIRKIISNGEFSLYE